MFNEFTISTKYGSRLFIIIGLITVLTACAGIFNPYIYPEKSERIKSTKLENTQKAISLVDKTTSKIESRLDTRAVSSRVLNAATFGLTVGLGVNLATGAALTDKSTSLIALGAGSTYSASQLFFPQTTEGVYLGAHTALSCLANRANTFLAAYEQAEATKLPDSCLTAYPALNDSQARLNAVLKQALNADIVIGVKIEDTQSSILLELNKQLLKESPSPEKVLAAAKSSLDIAAGLKKSPDINTTPSAIGESQTRPRQRVNYIDNAVTTCSIEPSEVDSQIEANTLATKALTDQLNSLGTPGSGCLTTDQQGAEQMSVSQTVVMLSPGEKQSIPVAGGLPDINFTWANGKTPSVDEVTVAFNNQTRILTLTGGKSKLKNAYTLQLTDKSVIPQQLSIDVKAG